MGAFSEVDGSIPRRLKLWRFPGVPIPERLRSRYTADPRKVAPAVREVTLEAFIAQILSRRLC